MEKIQQVLKKYNLSSQQRCHLLGAITSLLVRDFKSARDQLKFIKESNLESIFVECLLQFLEEVIEANKKHVPWKTC